MVFSERCRLDVDLLGIKTLQKVLSGPRMCSGLCKKHLLLREFDRLQVRIRPVPQIRPL